MANLATIYALLTFILLFVQFYLLRLKLPFDIAFSQKTVGFFSIYLQKLGQNWEIWRPLIAFIMAQVLIQACFTMIIFFFTKQLLNLSARLERNKFLIGVLVWLLAQLTVFLWNSYLFPYSFFANKPISCDFHAPLCLILLLTLTTGFAISTIAILICAIHRHPRKFLYFVVSLAILFCSIILFRTLLNHQTFRQFKEPNVIVIITDSLRPEYVSPEGKTVNKNRQAALRTWVKNNDAHVEDIISQSAFFKNSFAVLGRSSPGLVTILTGDYPKKNGARFNLIPSKYLRMQNSLTSLLKSRGYQTIFMADGRQFINLDKSFDFDQVIAAKGGIYDFIFTFINDTPLSNLLANTIVGEFLFPYTYANRNAYYNYLPATFNTLVKHNLKNLYPEKPVFLVAALTLPHWPYVWARQPELPSISDRYQNSIFELDKQFKDLMHLFTQRGLLRNTIVVILSDHGDSLGLPGDRIISAENYIGPANRLKLIPNSPVMIAGNKGRVSINSSTGHGTDLLSLTQLQTTLAFHQENVIQPRIVSERVALIDVAPTILDLLNIPLPKKSQGISLKPYLLGQSDLTEFNRPIFLETEIDIPLIDVTKENNTNHSAVSRLIAEYSDLYDINLITQQLVLKDNAISRLLTEKQYGIIYHDWLLAYFPGKNAVTTEIMDVNSPDLKNCFYRFPAEYAKGKVKHLFCFLPSPSQPYFVLTNLTTRKWQILFENDARSNPIFNELLQKMKTFYAPSSPTLLPLLREKGANSVLNSYPT